MVGLLESVRAAFPAAAECVCCEDGPFVSPLAGKPPSSLVPAWHSAEHSPLVRSMVHLAARIAWAGELAVGSSPDRNPVVTAGMIGRRSDLAH